MILIEEIALDNGLQLRIFDLSRVIAADTVKVEVNFKAGVDLQPSYFSNRQDYLDVKKIFGDELTYEHKMERTFVAAAEKDMVIEELISTFKNNSLNYLAHEQFARKMAHAWLRDIRLNPFKYHGRPDEAPSKPEA